MVEMTRMEVLRERADRELARRHTDAHSQLFYLQTTKKPQQQQAGCP